MAQPIDSHSEWLIHFKANEVLTDITLALVTSLPFALLCEACGSYILAVLLESLLSSALCMAMVVITPRRPGWLTAAIECAYTRDETDPTVPRPKLTVFVPNVLPYLWFGSATLSFEGVAIALLLVSVCLLCMKDARIRSQ